MRRAKFTRSGNYVTAEYDDAITGERVCRDFFVPWTGGYVREATYNNHQVCNNLAHRGPTLSVNDPSELLDLIRREYRALKNSERAESKRYA